MTHSALSTERMLTSIAEHSAALAEVVEHHFDASVQHCPGWTVADLVDHVTEVHWFWSTIAQERPAEEPGAKDPRRPQKVTDPVAAVARFESGAARMVDVLRAADQDAVCWTWAPSQQNIGFITRHQVQEIAVHHWDAVDAVGGALGIEPDIADDAVSEFLTFSVSSDSDTAPAERGSLPGRFQLRATDTGTIWHVHSGQKPATVAFEIAAGNGGSEGAGDAEIAATASDLLLWLYDRISLDTSAVDPGLLAQFRRLSYTD